MNELKADGIVVDNLTDKQVVEQVSRWLLRKSRSLDKVFTTFYIHYPDGKPAVYPGLEEAFEREFNRDKDNYDWTIDRHFDHELLGRGMFYNKTHGSCTSTAVYLTTVLRAVGIPTRMIIVAPAVDASDREQLRLVKDGITHNKVRETMLAGLRKSGKGFTNHTINEVYVGNRWHRLDYSKLGRHILSPHQFGLDTHLYTFNDLSEANLTPTWGRRYAKGERDDVFKHSNPYTAIEVSDLFGSHSDIPNPPFTAQDLSSSPLPDIFVMEPERREKSQFSIWEEVLSVVKDVTYNKTGRPHKKEHYDDIFEGVYAARPGDIIVLLFSLDTKERIPDGYEDLLPKPWSEIEASLKQGKTVELGGKARNMNVILLAAPKRAQLEQLIRESGGLTALAKGDEKRPISPVGPGTGGKVVGIGPGWQVFKEVAADRYKGSCSHHTAKFYSEVLSWARPGDTFVFLFAFDEPNQRVPEQYQDLLPQPWSQIDRRVRQDEMLELEGQARGLDVVVLAAPTLVQLEQLIRESSLFNGLKKPTVHKMRQPSLSRTELGKSNFSATLSNGVTVELVGACEYPGNRTWRPDGLAIKGELRVKQSDRVKGEYNLGFLVRVKGTKDFKLKFEIEGSGGYYGLDVLDSEGQELENVRAAVARLDDDRTVTAVKLGVATGPWEVVTEYDVGGTFVGSKDILFSSPIETERGTAIALRGEWGFDGERRIIAVDKAGNIHTGGWHGRSTGLKTLATTEFYNLKSEQIQKYQLQFRPYEWVTFENVSLKSGYKTDVQVEAAEIVRGHGGETVDSGEFTGRVVDEEGKAVAGAQVALSTEKIGVMVSHGKLKPMQVDVESRIVQTDSQGIFDLGQRPAESFDLIVAHEAGFALVGSEEFIGSREIQLQPWGRVEGQLAKDRKATDNKIALYSLPNSTWFAHKREYRHETKCDESGRFIFDKVPPGWSEISYLTRTGEHSWSNTSRTPVEVKPGQAAKMKLGGEGQPVIGRFVPPEGYDKPVYFGQGLRALQTTRPDEPRPENYDRMTRREQQRWRAQWRKSDQYRQYRDAYWHDPNWRQYTFRIDEDGSFRIEDVIAGKYDFTVWIQERGRGPGRPEEIAGYYGTIEVPEMPGRRSDEPLDLGELELTMHEPLRVGDAAPLFEAKTLDGKDLKLIDYRGRFVLLSFWQPLSHPEIEQLRELYDAHNPDGRLEIIGLGGHDTLEEVRKYVEENDIPWPQIFTGEESKSGIAKDYRIPGVPWIFLVGPDGKIIAKNLHGEKLKSAVHKALGATSRDEPDVEVEGERSDKSSESKNSKQAVEKSPDIRGRISGVVVNSVTGEPIAGAYVGAGDFGDSGGSNYSRHRSQGFHDKTKTDENGRFELEGLVFTDDHPYLKTHPLVVTHSEFIRHDQKIELPIGGPVPDIEVSLTPAASVKVTVVDSDVNPLEGHWLLRLEALDGRRFIPPGSDPHLSSFASSIWAHWPDLRSNMGLSEGFTFTELDTGEYSIEAIRLHMVVNPTPQNVWKPAVTYHGSIPSFKVQAGQTKDVWLSPQDYKTSLTITPPEFPDTILGKLKRSSHVPLMCLISRSTGLLLWDDGKVHHLEDRRLGRVDKNRFFRGFFAQGKPLTINNLPPGSYALFAVSVYREVAACLIGMRVDLAKGSDLAVEIPWREPQGPSQVGPNRAFDYPVKLEAKEYTAARLCEMLTNLTESDPRLVADPSIQEQKVKLPSGHMCIWDVLETLYMDKGWIVEEAREKTLLLRPPAKADVQGRS
ncbi:MAG: redoxin domain-containing protein [Phycisphaerales bacterium]